MDGQSGVACDRTRFRVIPRLAALLSQSPSRFLARASTGGIARQLAPGTDVTITFLPATIIATPSTPRRAAPRRLSSVPHIAAREIASREALDISVAARGEADVRRVVLIAGDVAAARGPTGRAATSVPAADRGPRHRARQRGRSSRSHPGCRRPTASEDRSLARLGRLAKSAST